ncbi:hypothetical protein, partial [Klebsiella pneumoniae]|uniref:hypothetical protein n=1 Tax=Klebsiella pneumoniae TaxID=573 RepID=UPI003D7ECCA4
VAEQEGLWLEMEATGTSQKYHHTQNQQLGSITCASNVRYWHKADVKVYSMGNFRMPRQRHGGAS